MAVPEALPVRKSPRGRSDAPALIAARPQPDATDPTGRAFRRPGSPNPSMTTTLPDHIVIPVETLNREFDGKLLLALCAHERGFKPIIGGRTALHRRANELPRSIYVSKGIRIGNRTILSLLHDLGHQIVALEEEGLVRLSDEAYLMMLDPTTFNRAAILYAWGHDNAEVWRRFRGYSDTPIVEAGNPRMDMLRPEVRGFYSPEVAELHRRFGRFVLFNSNFSFVNHFIPGFQRFRVAENAGAGKSQEIKSGIYRHKATLFEHFRHLMPQLSAAVRPHNLVIRPHPSENAQTWKDIVQYLPNVHVVHEGPVAPWLMAATALVHNTCTSGIEAAILGTPALSYRPVRSADYDPPLPNLVSEEFDTAEGLCAAAQDALNRNAEDAHLSEANRAHLAPHIAALDGALSCERIIAALLENRERLESWPAPGTFGRLRGRLGVFARNARRAATTRMMGKSSAAYTEHKFPGLDDAHVNDRIARFREVLGRFRGLRARRLRPDIFTIEAT
jgi:surface carbohydrate biosynthesis protein